MRSLVIVLFSVSSFLSIAAVSVHADVLGQQLTSYVCTARSITGRRCTAVGTDKVLTQEAAMQKCEKESWRCYPTGCQVSP
jgi:hypothetical protein